MNKRYVLGVFLLIFVVGFILLLTNGQNKEVEKSDVGINNDEIISRNGLHTHPKLEINVDGESVLIPVNIGVGPQNATMPTYDAGMRMTAMHTHEPDGTIHLEFQGVVTNDDTKLGNFFTIWQKEFMSFGESVTMTVNGEENTELEDYQMKDGDLIVLNYKNI